jgi:Cys-tRNA(Pro)/Cys-tRNA(Cys) deacylase
MDDRIRSALDTANANYSVRRHADMSVPIAGPGDFAAAIGYDIDRITKTLFLKTHDDQRYAMVVCPASAKVDFKRAARAAGLPRLEVASRQELDEQVGYPPTGVTPLGVSDRVSVLVDEALLQFDSILVGGGEVGVEIEIRPSDLVEITGAIVTRTTKVS